MDYEFYEEDLYKDDDRVSEIAETVNTSSTRATNLILTLHGPHSDNKRTLLEYSNEIVGEYNILPNVFINIMSNMKYSYVLEGVDSNKITFNNKVNHLLLHKCKNTSISLRLGTISGIDILYCSNLTIIEPNHNYTNIEYSNNMKLSGNMNVESKIKVLHSMDILNNKKSLPIGIFSNAEFSRSPGDPGRLEMINLSSSAPPKLMLSLGQ